VLPPSPPASPLSWSPDGKRIAFVRQATPHTGDSDKCAVQIIDLATGAVQPLTGGSLLESFPSFSPDGEKLYRDQSPMTYLARAKTPTLIMCTTGDFRVPPTQSYKLYHVLKGSGVPVSMVAYPVAGHFPGDPYRSRDVYRRWAEWLDKYLCK